MEIQDNSQSIENEDCLFCGIANKQTDTDIVLSVSS